VGADEKPNVTQAQTRPLPLWGAAAADAAASAAVGEAPPLGFVALSALIAADPPCLGTLQAVAPRSHRVDCVPADGSDVENPDAWTPRLAVEVTLDVLGQGSYATVYPAVVGGRAAVMKVAHCPTVADASLVREASVIASLRHDRVPRLLGGTWERDGASGRPVLGALVLSPLGIPLLAALDRLIAKSQPAWPLLAFTVDAVLATLADASAPDRAVRWSHCDVRAPNILLTHVPAVPDVAARSCDGGGGSGGGGGFDVIVNDWGVAKRATEATMKSDLKAAKALLTLFSAGPAAAACAARLPRAHEDTFMAASSFDEARRALAPLIAQFAPTLAALTWSAPYR